MTGSRLVGRLKDLQSSFGNMFGKLQCVSVVCGDGGAALAECVARVFQMALHRTLRGLIGSGTRSRQPTGQMNSSESEEKKSFRKKERKY